MSLRRRINKVTLPSGKIIEVASFEPDEAEATQPAELHICPECNSGLVYPTAWEEVDRWSNWGVSLRCPNCEWTTTGTFAEEPIQRFNEELDRGTEALVSVLRELVQENLEDDFERFIAALNAEYILPEDF